MNKGTSKTRKSNQNQPKRQTASDKLRIWVKCCEMQLPDSSLRKWQHILHNVNAAWKTVLKSTRYRVLQCYSLQTPRVLLSVLRVRKTDKFTNQAWLGLKNFCFERRSYLYVGFWKDRVPCLCHFGRQNWMLILELCWGIGPADNELRKRNQRISSRRISAGVLWSSKRYS